MSLNGISFVTRRTFLATGVSLLSTTSAVGCLGWGKAAAAPAVRAAAPGGFLGDRGVLIVVHDGGLDLPQSFAVPEGAGPSPDPTSRYGGLGRLNGEELHFSGGRNQTEPRLATPWTQKRAESYNPSFEPTDLNARMPADRPEVWDVRIDGQPVTVNAVARKTVPVRSAEIDRNTPAHETRHLIMLTMDSAVPDGAKVEVRAPLKEPFMVERRSSVSSEIVHVCQEGYPLAGPKRGFVGQWLGHDADGMAWDSDDALSEATAWRLVDDSDGSIVQSGTLEALPREDFEERPLTGCTMYQADFTAYDRLGQYRLEVVGVGTSLPFAIAERPYNEALRLAARWYYYQRSGMALEEPYAEGFTRPRNGFPEDGLTVWQSDVRLAETSEGLGGPYAPGLMRKSAHGGPAPAPGDVPRAGEPNASAWGGWHDAGDWDRRAQHLEVVYSMAWLVETLPVVSALELNLPESGRSFADPAVRARVDSSDLGDGRTILPDLVHEALWGLSLWRRTQLPDGAIIGGVEYSQVGVKGSYSWDPVERSHAYAPDPWAAYLFAAAAAKLGHVIARKVGDEILGERLIEEGRRAWQWAEAQEAAPEVSTEDENVPPEITSIWQARLAAAATLYRVTGAEDARAIFERANAFRSEMGQTLRLRRGVHTAQSLEYHFAGVEGRPVNADLRAEIVAWARGIPQRDRRRRISRDFGLHTTTVYPWGRGWLRFGPGSNWPAHRIALALSVMEGTPEDLKIRVHEGMWFALGCNPSNVSFVQGLGARAFSDPLLLDRPRGGPIPGQLSFGVAGGEFHEWEEKRIRGAIYPAAQDDWPLYTQIYESRHVAICSEHGIKSNALEWLIACALVRQLEAA